MRGEATMRISAQRAKTEMFENPLVSVIICTYNRSHLLPRAINSVLNQTYKKFQLIIVDDSTDNTEEVVKLFKDNRIKYYKHENKGLLAARNRGIDLAKGKYIAFLDDDDELLKQALETAIDEFSRLSSKGVKMLLFDCLNAEKGNLSASGIRKDGFVSYEDVLCHRIFGDFWVVMKRDLIGDERFDERLWGDEVQLWLKLYHKCKVYHISKILSLKYKKHGGERVSTILNYKIINRRVLTNKKFIQEYGPDMRLLCPQAYGTKLGSLGFWQILQGQRNEGRNTLISAMKFNRSILNIARYLIPTIVSLFFSQEQIIFLYSSFYNYIEDSNKLGFL